MGTRTGIDRRRARGTVATVEDATRQLRRSFAVAERNLTRELEVVTERLVSDPSLLGATARREQIRGVFADVAEMRADLDRQAQLFARGSLSKVYAEGASRASRALGLDPGAGSFTGAHRRALEVLATDTFDDLASATQFVEARAKLAIREASRLGVLTGAATGTSVQQDTAALLGRFRRDGVTAFTAANGARWRLGTYAEMVARTKSASAYNTGTIIRAREVGTDVFGIVDGDRSGHEECLAYNGKTCSGSWAFAHPIEHPNCVRSFTPLPLHRGPVDYGEVQGPQAAAALDDDPLAGVLADPDAWTRDATTRRTADGAGATMPGPTAQAANRELIRRGKAVDAEVDRRAAAAGGRKVSDADLEAARGKMADAHRAAGEARDRWIDQQVARGVDWSDAFEVAVNDTLRPAGWVPGAAHGGLRLPDDIVGLYRAAERALDAVEELRVARRAYGAFYQQAARDVLAERRGTGALPSFTTGDASVRAIAARAASHYPTAWTDRLSDSWDRLVVLDVKGGRGHNKTWQPETRGRFASEVVIRPDDLSLALHELGHSMERAVPGLQAAEWAFIRSRTTGPRGGLGSTRDLGGAMRGERYYDGAGLPDNYSAKVYGRTEPAGGPRDAWELFTTGVEGTLGDRRSWHYVEGDDEFRSWVLGVLTNLG